MRTWTPEGDAHNVQRRAHPSFDDNAIALTAGGTDAAGEDRAGLWREPGDAIVATRLGVGPHTIGKWRKRFIADRIEGLYDEMRTGGPARSRMRRWPS